MGTVDRATKHVWHGDHERRQWQRVWRRRLQGTAARLRAHERRPQEGQAFQVVAQRERYGLSDSRIDGETLSA